jgi:O-acetyl-ADP-ribose deacetylase (regulator of RNase III)
MTQIKYEKGDATDPQGEGKKLIIHITNNIGRWGAGFVLAISKRWAEPEMSYRSLQNYTLGEIQIIPVEDNLSICNMIAQEGVGWKDGQPPIRYEALRSCLKKVAQYCSENGYSIVGPRLGAGLSGGKWELIEQILEEELCPKNIDVMIYDLPDAYKNYP